MLRNDRILIIDDDDAFLWLVNEVLSIDGVFTTGGTAGYIESTQNPNPGFNITTCNNGEEALRKISTAIETRRKYATAFIDIRLATDDDGVSVAREIRKLDEDIEIVMMSGDFDCTAEQFMGLVPPAYKFHYLQKPIQPVLMHTMATLLSKKWAEIQKVKMEIQGCAT